MKFYNYLNESERMTEITEKNLLYYLNEKCPKNLKYTLNGHVLKRGTDHSKNYFMGNSLKGEMRRSANTTNYYTLMIDNSKYWKDYPKRSKSFICATYKPNYNYNDYVVIPYDNTKMGVCPSQDMWDGFVKQLKGDSLESFNIHLDHMFNVSLDEDSWKILKNQLNNPNFIDENYNFRYDFMHKWYNDYQENENENVKFTDYWEKAFDPKKNEFKLVNSLNKLPENNEIWFSGKALFIIEKEWFYLGKKLKDN